MALVNDYLSFTKKWKQEYGEKTIVLMQVGSFFEVYALKKDDDYVGSNIKEFAQICEFTITKKSACVGKDQVMMSGFGLTQLDKYIRKLQENNYTTVIYTQDTQSKNTTRSLAQIVSPGTFFGTETQQLSNNSMCVWIHKTNENHIFKSSITIGISNIDIFTGKSTIYQYEVEDYHNPCTYDDLEKHISIYKPSECVFITNIKNDELSEVIEFVNVSNAKIHKININEDNNDMSKFAQNAEKQAYQMTIMARFFPTLTEETLVSIFPSHYVALQSFTFLLDFVNQHNPNLVHKLALPEFANHSDNLILANHSLTQLNMLDDSRHTGKYKSVNSLLNNCMTTMGKRRFIHQLNNPITNVDLLNESYDITEHLLKNKWGEYRSHLSNMKDIEKFYRRLVLKRISPKDLGILVEDLEIMMKIDAMIRGDDILFDFFKKYELDDLTNKCKKIKNILNENFSLKKCLKIDDLTPDSLSKISSDDISFIKAEKNPTIHDLINKSYDGMNKLEAIANTFTKLVGNVEKSTKTAVQYIKIHETPKSDPMLIGTKRRITLLETEIKKRLELNKKTKERNSIEINYVSSVSNKTECFELKIDDLATSTMGSNKKDLIILNSQIREIAGEIQKSKDKLIQEIILHFNQFIQEFILYQSDIQDIINGIIQIDVLQNKSYIAHTFNYCKPKIQIKDKSFIDFKEIRHPLIEHIQTRELYVTNDLELGTETDGLLLYGTNAVGKTSFIKSVGIAVIMAQAGLYVPCKEFIYSPYSYIFTRILGNDNLFKGLSTFAVEMSELRTILKHANENSLILGDELCSGTESDSALSIFTAGLELLHEKKSTHLFATHFHEVCNYDEIKALDNLKMMHMEVIFDKESRELVYDRKLKDGPGESMYGLEVCKSLDLPGEFLKRAHDIRMKYNAVDSNVLSQKGSHFNAKKIKDKCELCKKHAASEVHHLKHQNLANDDNSYIESFHKNHMANLINICHDCHETIHKSGKQHKIVKTSNGYKFLAVSHNLEISR